MTRKKPASAKGSRKRPVPPPPVTTDAPGVPFPVVCIGASAGGLEAISQLLRAVPADTGMAFVVILHLDPSHVSLLKEILSRHTTMPVQQVKDKMALAPDAVYVIPPGKDMTLGGDRLRLVPRTELPGQHRPIDHFLRSLAERHGHKAIGVILSGTASDGTRGLAEVKAAGGVTFAQDDTAEQTGMPRSAIDTGCVDFVLPADEIGRQIGRISRHPYAARDPEPPESGGALGRVLELLRESSGVDFRNYKRNTLYRRITRRMLLRQLDGLQAYVDFLATNPAELEALYRDVLINVTSFFRDPESFEALKTAVFPALTADKSRTEPVRVWTLGCSTGEEAYSIAMAYAEYAEAADRHVPMHLFATDLNGASIERARAGVYPKSIAQDVSPERLRKFFVEVEGSYRISKPIRDVCVFAQQNALADAPFSRIDLVVCRNMLIYLDATLQQRLIPILHYALRGAGFLWLGSSETIGAFRDLFEIVDPRHKIYVRKPGGRHRLAQVPVPVRLTEAPPPRGEGRADQPQPDPHKEADRMLLARYAPAGVVVDRDLQILQFRGDTSPYLMPAPGRASLSLVKMLREGLMVAVRGALHKARREGRPVREPDLRVKSGDGYREVSVMVLPIAGSGPAGGNLLVLFEEPTVSAEARARRADAESRARAEQEYAEPESLARENARLSQELEATREYLQSVIEQQEASNEELQSANEEVQSTNEELQSINEELETSKEEIQSSNEELATVNDELHTRNLELADSNNDLTNLLASVQMPIVMLDRDLRIHRFTPAAEKMFKLIPSDTGRPIGDIKLRLSVRDLEPLLKEVVDTLSTHVLDVQDQAGRWHLLRISPYRRLREERTEGVVLLLVDVDSLKRAQHELLERDRSKTEFLAMLAHELRNPLAALCSAAEVIAENKAGAAARDRARVVLERQTVHMKRMVDDLVDASRITQGTLHLQLEPVDLGQILQSATAATEHLRRDSAQKVELSLPPEPLMLTADATRLEQVFDNLLSNASKFTKPGGQVWVRAAREANGGAAPQAVVHVRDNGDGIEPKLLPKVFEMFVQADHSLERRRAGLGIGLALARKLVELHGGTIDASSSGASPGSEFVVRLPMTTPGGQHGEADGTSDGERS